MNPHALWYVRPFGDASQNSDSELHKKNLRHVIGGFYGSMRRAAFLDRPRDSEISGKLCLEVTGLFPMSSLHCWLLHLSTDIRSSGKDPF